MAPLDLLDNLVPGESRVAQGPLVLQVLWVPLVTSVPQASRA